MDGKGSARIKEFMAGDLAGQSRKSITSAR